MGRTLSKIRYGVIGIGGVGREHVKCALKIPELDLVAVADVNEQFLAQAKEEYGVKTYTDYIEMIEKEKLDAVSVCVPHFLHATITINAIKAGAHVLVEKPIAISVKEADEMINAAKKKGVKLAVVFQNRTNPLYQEVKRIIDEEGIGELLRAQLTYLCYRTQSYYQSAAWRGKWKTEGGGVLINQAIHFIDLFQWLTKTPVKRIRAFINTIAHEIEVEDIASAAIEFENGALGTIQVSSIDTPGELRIEIRGDEKAVIIENDVATIYYNNIPIKESIKKLAKWESPTYTSKKISLEEVKREWGHKVVLEDFAKAILFDKEPMVTGEEALKSLEIVNAIILSSVKKKEVTLPVDRNEYEEVLKELSEKKAISR